MIRNLYTLYSESQEKQKKSFICRKMLLTCNSISFHLFATSPKINKIKKYGGESIKPPATTFLSSFAWSESRSIPTCWTKKLDLNIRLEIWYQKLHSVLSLSYTYVRICFQVTSNERRWENSIFVLRLHVRRRKTYPEKRRKSIPQVEVGSIRKYRNGIVCTYFGRL